MEEKTKVQAISALIALLVSLGFNFVDVDSDVYDKTFVCKGESSYFDGGTSGSKITAYPTSGSRSSPTYCYSNTGKSTSRSIPGDSKIAWQNVRDYAAEKGIDLNTIFQKEQQHKFPPKGVSYRCHSPNICEEV